MKKMILLASLILSFSALAQETADSGEMALMMKHMTPAAQHATMAELVGKWKTESSLWMAPDTPPSVSEGQCEYSMAIGGRYQRSVYSGTLMGMPFEGEGMMGYDNTKKKFQSTWIDNFGTSVSYMAGDYDEASKTYTVKGTMTDAVSAGDMQVRMVTRIESNDRFVMEMYMLMGEQEFKTLEIVHTRM